MSSERAPLCVCLSACLSVPAPKRNIIYRRTIKANRKNRLRLNSELSASVDSRLFFCPRTRETNTFAREWHDTTMYPLHMVWENGNCFLFLFFSLIDCEVFIRSFLMVQRPFTLRLFFIFETPKWGLNCYQDQELSDKLTKYVEYLFLACSCDKL